MKAWPLAVAGGVGVGCIVAGPWLPEPAATSARWLGVFLAGTAVWLLGHHLADQRAAMTRRAVDAANRTMTEVLAATKAVRRSVDALAPVMDRVTPRVERLHIIPTRREPEASDPAMAAVPPPAPAPAPEPAAEPAPTTWRTWPPAVEGPADPTDPATGEIPVVDLFTPAPATSPVDALDPGWFPGHDTRRPA